MRKPQTTCKPALSKKSIRKTYLALNQNSSAKRFLPHPRRTLLEIHIPTQHVLFLATNIHENSSCNQHLATNSPFAHGMPQLPPTSSHRMPQLPPTCPFPQPPTPPLPKSTPAASSPEKGHLGPPPSACLLQETSGRRSMSAMIAMKTIEGLYLLDGTG